MPLLISRAEHSGGGADHAAKDLRSRPVLPVGVEILPTAGFP